MTLKERVIVETYTGVCMTSAEEREEVYKYMAELMERPVYTHELASEEIQEQLKEKSKDDFIALCRNSVETALDELKSSGWIPCSEKLPNVRLTYDIFRRPDMYVSEPVLVTVKSKEIGGTRYYVSTDLMTGRTLESIDWLKSCGYGGSAVYSQEIIAWRPLPEAYTPEEG